MQRFDVIVAGGGMVGALTANLLARQQLSVLVVERFDATALRFDQAPSLRTSAFNRFSLDLLQSLDVWQYVTAQRRAPYTGLQTWEQQRCDQALCFDAADVGRDFLGHILENNLVQSALWQNFADLNITVKCPASIASLTDQQDAIVVELDNGEHIAATLLIGADGAQSKVRQMAGIGSDGWQYQQHCMAMTVQMAESQPPVTWQAFHPSGPRAYLPLFDRYASLIWYDDADKIKQLNGLSNDKLSQQVIEHFDDRLGEFKLLDKGAFPLTRMHAKRYYAPRIALVGDAAHTINPLAGQGVNLGFKDADKLTQCVLSAIEQGEDYGLPATLQKYHQGRYKANLLMMSAMDMFYVGFCNDHTPLSKLRSLGLSLANKAGPVKNQVMKYAMGL